MISDHISSLDLSRRPFTAQGDSGTTYTADAVILATGAQAKWLGLRRRRKSSRASAFRPARPATGSSYRGKEVREVTGGGNTAVEEALFLTNFASKVTLIHRRDELRSRRSCKTGCSRTRWNFCGTTVEEILGTEKPLGVTGVRAKNVKTGEETVVPCDGFFVAIGHASASELVKDQAELHHGAYVKVKPGSTETSIPGVFFAAGDLTDHVYRRGDLRWHGLHGAGCGTLAGRTGRRKRGRGGGVIQPPEASPPPAGWPRPALPT
ncbi:MAG: FAD-dependent oxidoreductase [Defluviimonas denitrificans]